MTTSLDNSRSADSRARLWADLSLLFVAAVWGIAFVAQRTAAGRVGPLAFNGARFGVGALVLLPLVFRRRNRAPQQARWRYGALLGALLFAAAALQQVGMSETTAGKAGFITGLYIVIVPLMLAVIWRERIHAGHWLGVVLAATGLLLLSVQDDFQLAPGDGWVLLSTCLWSLHVISVSRLVPGRDPVQLALMQYLVCTLLNFGAVLLIERETLSSVFVAWPEIAYTGILSIGLGYTLQLAAQRHTPPAHTVLILSLEAVFAAGAGWLWLGEGLTLRQIIGCGLMLAGMGAVQAQYLVTNRRG